MRFVTAARPPRLTSAPRVTSRRPLAAMRRWIVRIPRAFSTPSSASTSAAVGAQRDPGPDAAVDATVWEGEALEGIRELLAQISDTDVSVLIQGESGVGKEIVARAVHSTSERREKPFVKVNCAALPTELLESELFGYEKGAFTGANARKQGRFEHADGGTIFLDEIGEMSPALQAKLLQVLQDGTFTRLGANREVKVDVRVVTATNRPLEEMVDAQTFRADLYFRLKVLTLAMPPLRTTGDDIILLARHFAEVTAQRYGLPIPGFEADVVNAMLNYPWPGNVRELKHLVERAVLLCGSEQLTASALMLDERLQESPANTLDSLSGMTLEAAEATLIRQTLDSTAGNVSAASRRLGITRMALRYRMQKHGVFPHR